MHTAHKLPVFEFWLVKPLTSYLLVKRVMKVLEFGGNFTMNTLVNFHPYALILEKDITENNIL